MQAIKKAGHARLIDHIKKQLSNQSLSTDVKTDLQITELELGQLYETYQDTIGKLQKCIANYNAVQRKSEIELRRLKIRHRRLKQDL